MNVIIKEWKKIGQEIGPAFVGLNMVLLVAIAARYLHSFLPGPTLNKVISEILFAVFMGLYIRNTLGLASRVEAGIKFAFQRVLRFGIILLGLRLSIQSVAEIGGAALLLVITCITVALAVAYAAGRLFNVPPRLAILIGVGTAICGNTAIVATAPVIDAKDDEISFAVAIITLFGLIAVTFYPIIGRALGMGDIPFGLWAGTAVNDTSQVVAVGAAFSPSSLDVATVVKLTRNTMMAPIIVMMGLVMGRSKGSGDAAKPALKLGTVVPLFIYGFLGMSLLRSVGIWAGFLPQFVDNPGDLKTAAEFLKFCDHTANFAILCALAGVGLGTDLKSVLKIGVKPFVVGLCVATVLAVVSLGIIISTGLGRV